MNKDSNVMPIPPLIKWTGGKRSQAWAIRAAMPAHARYFEPFVGGGAVLFTAARPGAVAGDCYAPLIALWRLVQGQPGLVRDGYAARWQQLQAEGADFYYQVRVRFNATQDPHDLNFLLRTCVNGIIRFNQRGAFNNSFHLTRRGMHPDRFAGMLDCWQARIAGVEFVCADYADTLRDAVRGDFAYLDPPYLRSRHRYTRNLEVDRLYAVLKTLNARGVHWALSFDGQRGECGLADPIPRDLYTRRLLLPSGNSAVGKVLNGPVEMVEESLYLNY